MKDHEVQKLINKLRDASINVFYYQEEVQELKALCHDLLEAVDKIGHAPYYITKHFSDVIEKHKETIKRHNLK
jgi:DnaJ-domain-containing protein 1